MSKTEILAELPKLRPDELAEVQAKLDQLAGEVWLDHGDLSEADKAALDAALADYQKSPNGGSSWEEVQARILAKLRL
jgi:putative addiction module component (TIGR02574 family)